MITLSKSGNTVTFAFDDNSGYLQNGTIDVPVNSLSLVIDSSDMVTFKKSASNDIFVSALVSDFGMSKSELEAWYKENMVGSTGGGGGGGITSGEVQTMIDNSISGKVDISANEVPDYYVSGTSEYTRYFPSQSEHATYANGLTTLNAVGFLGFGSDSVWHTTIEIINEQGQTISGSCNLYVNDVNNTSIVPTALTNYMTATVDKTAPGSTVAVYTLEDGWKISWVNMYTDRDYDIPTMGMTITNSYVSKIYDGGQSEYVIENVIEPELVRLDSEKQNVLSAGTGISISGNVISATGGGITSGEVQTMIDESISGKVDTDTYTAYTAATDSTLSNKADKSEIPSVSGYADSVKYNSTSKYVEFYHGGTEGTKVFEYDASPFLIDGMVQNVEIKDVTSGSSTVTCLVISFNTDAGKQDINIPISEIFNANNYYTKSETDSAITAATNGLAVASAVTQEISEAVSGKQDTLVAGENITISGNVISATGGGGEVSSAITSGDTNAVAGGVLWDELRLPAEGESGLTLEWENHDEGYTTNYPSGQCSKITIYTDVFYGGNNYYFRNSGDEDLGFIYIAFEDDTAYVSDYSNCTYTMSGNVITVEYTSIAANVDHIYSAYDNNWTTIAYINSTVYTPLINQVSANTATLASLEENVNENEEVTARALIGLSEADEVTARALVDLNDKFGGLKFVKLTQAEYNSLATKDSSTLYIIVN